MFSSKKDDKTMASAPPPPMQTQQGMRKRTAAPSIISADLIVSGTLKSTGDVQIDGRVEGDVQSATLVIGEKAFVQGDVMAEEVTVRGRIEGSIKARKVLLASTCRVNGNILHEAFAVETGAFFEGNCRHADNPLGDNFLKPDAVPAPAPAASHAAPPPPVAPRPAAAAPAATFTALKS